MYSKIPNMKKLENNWKLLTKITQICTWNLGWPMEKKHPWQTSKTPTAWGWIFDSKGGTIAVSEVIPYWKHRCQLISLDWYLFSTLRNHARHVFCRFFFNFLAQHLSLFNPIGSQSRHAQPHPASPPVEDDVPSWAFCTEGSTNMTWHSAPRDFVRQNCSVSLPGSQ